MIGVISYIVFFATTASILLWLVTLAKDHAFTFIDHALKHGDSLVGLTKKQIAALHWKVETDPEMDLFEEQLKKDTKKEVDHADIDRCPRDTDDSDDQVRCAFHPGKWMLD